MRRIEECRILKSSITLKIIYQEISLINILQMEPNKYRSFPPAVPLKMNKLLEY